MSVFDIIGPRMVGPSSSHTAGALRLGLLTRALLGRTPERARVGLHGSFATTYRGHGTDRAVVAGLLGMAPDDQRIPRSLEVAREAGLEVEFEPVDLGPEAHPNTLRFEVEAGGQRRHEVPRLVGVREDHVSRRHLGDDLLDRGDERVRRIHRQRLSAHREHLFHAGLRQLGGHGGDVGPAHGNLDGGCSVGQLLRRGDGLPARAVELALFLFGNDQNHRTLASSRRRLTSSCAASAGDPPIMTVCLAFCGA